MTTTPSSGLPDQPAIHIREPMELSCTYIRRGQRGPCRVRERVGQHQTRLVLLSATPGTSDPYGYAFDKVIFEHKKSGVSLILAHPVKPGNAACTFLISYGTPVAIKVVPHRRPRRHVDNPFTEIAALQLMAEQPHRAHVINLIDCLEDSEFTYMVLPLLHGDLFSVVEQKRGLSDDEARAYLRQIIDGLLSMKSCGLAHHDVSLENIGVDENGSAKIIDLGMCLRVPKVSESEGLPSKPVYLTSQTCCGKAGYVAPEVSREEPCDPFAADVWSLGVCLYCMLTGRPIYTSPQDSVFRVMARGGIADVMKSYEKYGLQVSDHAKDLICHMLSGDASKRPTLEEVLEHPFLRGGDEDIDGGLMNQNKIQHCSRSGDEADHGNNAHGLLPGQ